MKNRNETFNNKYEVTEEKRKLLTENNYSTNTKKKQRRKYKGQGETTSFYNKIKATSTIHCTIDRPSIEQIEKKNDMT